MWLLSLHNVCGRNDGSLKVFSVYIYSSVYDLMVKNAIDILMAPPVWTLLELLINLSKTAHLLGISTEVARRHFKFVRSPN